MQAKKNATFGSSFGFVMASVGSAVGLGNLWKFPYLTGRNGGAAFVLVYLVFLVFVGVALTVSEVAVGRIGKGDAVTSWEKAAGQKFKFIGYLGGICVFIILSFYSVIGGWALKYALTFLTGRIETGHAEAFFSAVSGDARVSVLFHFIFMALTAAIIWRGLQGGLERFSKLTMPALFVLMIILAVRSLTLPGAAKGVEFFLKPNWNDFGPRAFVEAAGQVFFSLSLGVGMLTTFGGYLSPQSNLPRNTFFIPVLDTVVALLAGFVVLPAVFAFGFEPGAGPGLLFITLPEVFAAMPFGRFFGLLFFSLVLFAALTSSISMLEMLVAYADHRGHAKRKAGTAIISLAIFLAGIPSALSLAGWDFTLAKLFGNAAWTKDVMLLNLTWFDLADHIASNLMMPLCGIFLSLACGWIIDRNKLLAAITSESRYKFGVTPFYFICVRFIAPAAILLVFLNVVGIIKF